MPDRRTFQVHANVNSDRGDSALRVTITFYDETGQAYSHQTFRAHCKSSWLEGSDWQAYSAVTDLAKMMANVCGTRVDLEAVDEALPGI